MEPTSSQKLRFITLGLILGTLAVYLPSAGYDFVAYDDDNYVYANPMVLRGLTWEGVVWAFTTNHVGNWHPLSWLSHMLDCSLFGSGPAGLHLINILLHVANVLLVFLFFRRMTGTVWRSAGVAALFAWHPLHVESVVWISERKDLLSTLFGLLALLAYHSHATPGSCSMNHHRCWTCSPVFLRPIRMPGCGMDGRRWTSPTRRASWAAAIIRAISTLWLPVRRRPETSPRPSPPGNRRPN